MIYNNVIISLFLSCRIDYKFPKGRASFYFSVSHILRKDLTCDRDSGKYLLNWTLLSFRPFNYVPYYPHFSEKNRGPEEVRESPKLVNAWTMTLLTHIFLPHVVVLFFPFNLVFPANGLSSSWIDIYRSFQHHAHTVKNYVWDLGILNLSNVWKKNILL